MNIAIFICFLFSCFSITMSEDTCSHYNLANGCTCALNQLNGKTWSIVILVDSTIGSITDAGFEAVRAYLLTYVGNFQIAADFSRVSVCQMFSSSTICLSSINNAQDQTAIQLSQIIESMAAKFDGGMKQTNVAAGVCEAKDQFGNYDSGKNSADIVLLISASSLQPGLQSQMAFACLQELRNNSVTIMTVAVSSSPLNRSVDLGAVANAGYEINACSYGQLDPSIPRRLSCEAAKQCPNPDDSTYATSPSPTTPLYPLHQPNPCSCTLQHIWLDIVIAIDVSAKMINYLEKVTAQLADFFSQISISQENFNTRVALITYSSDSNIIAFLNTFHDFDALNASLRHIQLSGDNSFSNNIRAAFADCLQILGNANGGGNKRKAYFLLIATALPSSPVVDLRDVLCANEVTISVMFVDVANNGIPPPEIYSKLVCNQGSLMIQFNNFDQGTLFHAMCQKNCYCPNFYVPSSAQFPQQVTDATGDVTGECVFSSKTPYAWVDAVDFCQLVAQNYKSYIVDVLSEAKDTFLRIKLVIADGLIDSHGVPSYWIGLNSQEVPGNYTWKQAATNLWLSPSDYSNWNKENPNEQTGKCVVSQKTSGFNMQWRSAPCDDFDSLYPAIPTITVTEKPQLTDFFLCDTKRLYILINILNANPTQSNAFPSQFACSPNVNDVIALFKIKVFGCALNQSNYLQTCIEDTQCDFRQYRYDIVFLVDSVSGSISTAAFNAVKKFIASFANNFNTSGKGRSTRIAIASVGVTNTIVNLPITYENASPNVIKIVLDQMTIQGGTVHTISILSALKAARDQFTQNDPNADVTAHRLVYFFTNTFEPLTKSVLEVADTLKTLLDTTLVTVAVSDNSPNPPSNLSILASDAAALQVCDLSALQNDSSQLMEYMKNLTCRAAIGECKEPPPNKPHTCACTPSKIWLDIVIALNVVDPFNKLNVNLTLKSIFKRLTINQQPDGTRIGLISFSKEANVTANLNVLNNTEEFLNRLSDTIRQSNDPLSNDLNEAFLKAYQVANGGGRRGNTRTVIMVVTDRVFQEPLTESASICTDKKNSIIFWQVQKDQPPNIIVGKCENWSVALNSNNFSSQIVIKTLCQANCFCPKSYSSFTEKGAAECIGDPRPNINWQDALNSCASLNGILVDIFSQEKQNFLDQLFINTAHGSPYYIGLKYNDNAMVGEKRFYWHSYGGQLIPSQPGDFYIKSHGYPNYTSDDLCVYSENGMWKTEDCSKIGFENHKQFFCQRLTCDTDYYCNEAINCC